MYYFNSGESYSSIRFGEKLSAMTENFINEYGFQEIVLLCIGTDCSTGDSLGPMIGYKLTKKTTPGFLIYGTLARPVHALNLQETIAHIKKHHDNALVIAVDASIGTSSHVGYVTLSDSPLKPGLGMKKNLPEVGHISITGIVNTSGVMDSLVLQSTRLSTVMNIADCICSGITFMKLRRRSTYLVDRL